MTLICVLSTIKYIETTETKKNNNEQSWLG